MARSRKPSRSSRKCRATGKLKHPVRLPSGRMRYCKKRRTSDYGGNKGDASRSRRDYSRKRSKKGSRSRRCKYGKLKHPVKSPSGRKRVCRKSRGPHRKSKKKSRSRKHSKKKSRSRKHSKKKSRSRKHSKKGSRKKSGKKSRSPKCRYGELKHPVKSPSGKLRYCKKRRSQKYGGNKGDLSLSKRDYKGSRSRSRKCKNGKLKTPVKTASGKLRYCKKSRKKSRSPRKHCAHGVLKVPVKLPSGRKRYCKKAPKSRRRRSKAVDPEDPSPSPSRSGSGPIGSKSGSGMAVRSRAASAPDAPKREAPVRGGFASAGF